MEDKALGRPLLLTKGVNFTRLAVDRVSALDQRAYHMLFIGTGINCKSYFHIFQKADICIEVSKKSLNFLLFIWFIEQYNDISTAVTDLISYTCC